MRILLCLFFFAPLFAEEQLVVHLNTQQTLTPLYIAPLQDKCSGFDQAYLRSLENVLRFDFEHNGATHVTGSSKNISKIETVIEKKSFNLKYTDGKTGAVKGIENISLTGWLPEDRRILHKIHDTVFETVFKAQGVADTRILYTVRTKQDPNAASWTTEIWEADYDGCNARQLTHENGLCVTPTFVPPMPGTKAHHFLFVSYHIGQPKIYISSLDDSHSQRLSFLKGNQLMPTVSPTLDKIAFISDITGNPDLFIQDFSLEDGLKGKPRQIFCAPGASQGTPTFNPDGTKIAFVSNKDGTPRIYILEIPQSGASIKTLKPLMISKQTHNNTCPAWSPDGTKIAYSGTIGGTRQIWIYDLVTQEETQLTDGLGHKENPTWAPNSLHLVYNASTPQGTDLHMINLNQKQDVKITNGPGEKRFPAWEPVRFNQKRPT